MEIEKWVTDNQAWLTLANGGGMIFLTFLYVRVTKKLARTANYQLHDHRMPTTEASVLIASAANSSVRLTLTLACSQGAGNWKASCTKKGNIENLSEGTIGPGQTVMSTAVVPKDSFWPTTSLLEVAVSDSSQSNVRDVYSVRLHGKAADLAAIRQGKWPFARMNLDENSAVTVRQERKYGRR